MRKPGKGAALRRYFMDLGVVEVKELTRWVYTVKERRR
jgi:hypothetical protein